MSSLWSCGNDVLRRVGAFLGPREAGRVQGVCRWWQDQLGPRCWYAGRVPVLTNLQSLFNPVDALIVDEDDVVQGSACYAAMDAIASGEIACPSTMVLRPLPGAFCLGVLTRILVNAPSRPRDIDVSVPYPLLDELLGALLVPPPSPMTRLAMGLCTGVEAQVCRILTFAYAHCTELVLRVGTPHTLRCLVGAMQRVADRGPGADRLSSFVVRTTFTNFTTGMRREGLTKALCTLPASVVHVDVDLAGASNLNDLDYDAKTEAPPEGRLERLRLGLMHTQITARGLRVLLGAFRSVTDWHLDLRHNPWSHGDWAVVGDLCRSLSTVSLTVTYNPPRSEADTFEANLRTTLPSTTVLCVRVGTVSGIRSPLDESHSDEDVWMEHGGTGC